MLLLTAVFWPVTAWVRRSFRARLLLMPAELKAYRLSRIGAILILAGLAVWGLLVAMLLKDFTRADSSSDPLLWFAEIFGTVAFIGGLILVLPNLRAVWRGKRRWPAKVWSIALTLSAVTVLWVALVFKLISFGANY